MRIQFIGAAGGSVTGSCTHFHYPRTNTRFLVDCGLVQGEGDFQSINSAPFPFDASELRFVLLTHAHLDHCGLLPKLYRAGFTGWVYCTTATAEMARLSLMDSAGYPNSLFSRDEVEQVRFHPIDLDPEKAKRSIFPIDKDLFVSFRRTAHIVGACAVTIGWLDDESKPRYIVMSGDLGNNTRENLYQPMLAHRRSIFGNPDAIVVESTYGNRVRAPELCSHEARLEAWRDLLQREVFERKSILIVPACAIQRTHEVLFDLFMVLRRWFSTDEASTAPLLAANRFWDDFSEGCWTSLADKALQKVLSTLPPAERDRWNDAFEDTGNPAFPKRLRTSHPATLDEVRELVDSRRVVFPVEIRLDAKLARAMGAVLRQELMRRSAHRPDEFASRNPELPARLGALSEDEVISLLSHLLPDPGTPAEPIRIGPHTIRFVEDEPVPDSTAARKSGTILLTGGGMCDGGPVLQHLQKMATQRRECVLVQTGYLSKHSLGRKLFDLGRCNELGEPKPDGTISIGTNQDIAHDQVHLRAVDLSGHYSGHADQAGLLDFIFTTDGRTPGGLPAQPATVFVNHGSPVCREALRDALVTRAAESRPQDRQIQGVELPASDQRAFDLQLGQWVDCTQTKTPEETMEALLREQVKTNELLRQILMALNRPASGFMPGQSGHGPSKKHPPKAR